MMRRPRAERDPATLAEFFREATWDEALDKAAKWLEGPLDRKTMTAERVAGFGSAKCSQ